jgi:glutamyl-Q tRNA(Asp) synthetase
LHFGSLVAAAGSYLQARSQRGRWLVRIEDLDPPREQPGASAQILRALAAYGFRWDGEIAYQSRRTTSYLDALAQLLGTGRAYYCDCTRKTVAAQGRPGTFGPIYPGTCRTRGLASGGRRSLRVQVHDHPICFNDRLQGRYCQRLESEIGDFIVRRADGLIAYHLAVVLDDAAPGVTEVVRGADLLDSTPRQLYLQQLLRLPSPRYLHLPVAVDARGLKLSKQTHARPIPAAGSATYLAKALRFLNHEPPAGAAAGLDALWRWAIEHWSAARLPRQQRMVPDMSRM